MESEGVSSKYKLGAIFASNALAGMTCISLASATWQILRETVLLALPLAFEQGASRRGGLKCGGGMHGCCGCAALAYAHPSHRRPAALHVRRHVVPQIRGQALDGYWRLRI